MERQVTTLKTGQTRRQVIYGLTSLSTEQVSPQQLLRLLRSYWQIENSLHYRRDVSLHEDSTRFKNRIAAPTMAIINNLVLALFAKADHSFLPSARRFFAAHPEEAISLLLKKTVGIHPTIDFLYDRCILLVNKQFPCVISEAIVVRCEAINRLHLTN